MSVKAGPPFSLFVDAAGEPLSSGFVYIGTANQDPVTNPIAVFSDAALSVSVAQPIRTLAGVPVVSGTPINLFVAGNYSMTVKDRNNVQVYTVPSAALAGGDITLASGETLEAQSGSTIDMKDGSTLNLGDGAGAGASVVVAATTRVTGNWVPAATGQDLGSLTNLWDAFLQNVKLSASLTPVTAGIPSLGTTSLPFAGVTSQEVTAKTVAVYATAQPASTSDLVKMDQLGCLLAACNQTNTGAAATLENLKNCGAINYVGTGQYSIDFTRNLGTGVRVAHVSLRDGPGEIRVSCGDTQALVTTRTSGGVAADKAFSFSVIGNPGEADPIS